MEPPSYMQSVVDETSVCGAWLHEAFLGVLHIFTFIINLFNDLDTELWIEHSESFGTTGYWLKFGYNVPRNYQIQECIH